MSNFTVKSTPTYQLTLDENGLRLLTELLSSHVTLGLAHEIVDEQTLDDMQDEIGFYQSPTIRVLEVRRDIIARK